MNQNNIVRSLPEVQIVLEGLGDYRNDCAVVLVGSVARNSQGENSDIDLLLISRNPLQLPSIPNRVHLMKSSLDTFLKQLESGEDFEAWCVRLGVPVHDSGLWAEIVNRDEARIWPSWKKKAIHGVRRLVFASRLIKTGDLESASEEMLYATGHIARGLLLKAEVFPLSRPELEQQVKAIGYPHLASIHEQLRTRRDNDLRFLLRCQSYSKKLLLHLSVDEYKKFSQELQNIKQKKRVLRKKNFG